MPGAAPDEEIRRFDGLPATRHGVVTVCSFSQQSRGHGDADDDEQDAAGALAPSPEACAESVPQLQADQCQPHTDNPYDEGGHDDVDVVRAECEPDGQVVDAQGRGEDDQATEARAAAHRRAVNTLVGAATLHQGIDPRQAQDETGNELGTAPEPAGDGVTEEEAEEWHGRLEHSEDDRYLETAGARTGHTERACRAEVVEPHCERDQQQSSHVRMLRAGQRPRVPPTRETRLQTAGAERSNARCASSNTVLTFSMS